MIMLNLMIYEKSYGLDAFRGHSIDIPQRMILRRIVGNLSKKSSYNLVVCKTLTSAENQKNPRNVY